MNNNFGLTKELRQSIAQKAKLNDKTGLKIVDLNAEVRRIQKERRDNGLSMLITVLPIHPDAFKDPNRSITIVRDPEYGVIYGISIGEYADGNIKWRRIPLQEHMSFDLNNDEQCKAFIVARMHPLFEGSPKVLQSEGRDYEFKIFDQEEDALSKEKKFDAVEKAIERAKELTGEGLVKFARLLSIPIEENHTVKILRGNIKEEALKNPFKFNEKWESNGRVVEEIFACALEVSVIKQSAEKGYLYEGYPLGMNHIEAKRFLNSNPDILAQVSRETTEKDLVMKKIKDESVEEIKTDNKAKSKGKAKTKEVEEEKVEEEDIEKFE